MAKFQFSLAIKGIALAMILAFVLSVGFGLVLSLTSIPESDMAINLVFNLSVLIAAIFVAFRAGTKGIYYGLSIGAGFMALLLILSAVFASTGPAWLKVGEKAIFSLVSGGAGGVVGVLIRRA